MNKWKSTLIICLLLLLSVLACGHAAAEGESHAYKVGDVVDLQIADETDVTCIYTVFLDGQKIYQSKEPDTHVNVSYRPREAGNYEIRADLTYKSGETRQLTAAFTVEPGVYEDCGICIAVPWQNHGFGKEVTKALMSLVFDQLDGHTFIYGCMRRNTRSAAVCRALGFVYAYSLEEVREWDGMPFTSDFYAKIWFVATTLLIISARNKCSICTWLSPYSIWFKASICFTMVFMRLASSTMTSQ